MNLEIGRSSHFPTRERVLVMVPAYPASRATEVLGLTWATVDFKANKIHIRLNLVDESKEKGGQDLKALKSKKSRRVFRHAARAGV